MRVVLYIMHNLSKVMVIKMIIKKTLNRGGDDNKDLKQSDIDDDYQKAEVCAVE